MFLKEIEQFKSTVENTIHLFFNLTPEEMKDEIERIENIYSMKYDLSKVAYIDVPQDTREVLLKYRTMKYFNSVHTKMMELYDFLKEGEKDGYEH